MPSSSPRRAPLVPPTSRRRRRRHRRRHRRAHLLLVVRLRDQRSGTTRRGGGDASAAARRPNGGRGRVGRGARAALRPVEGRVTIPVHPTGWPEPAPRLNFTSAARVVRKKPKSSPTSASSFSSSSEDDDPDPDRHRDVFELHHETYPPAEGSSRPAPVVLLLNPTGEAPWRGSSPEPSRTFSPEVSASSFSIFEARAEAKHHRQVRTPSSRWPWTSPRRFTPFASIACTSWGTPRRRGGASTRGPRRRAPSVPVPVPVLVPVPVPARRAASPRVQALGPRARRPRG